MFLGEYLIFFIYYLFSKIVGKAVCETELQGKWSTYLPCMGLAAFQAAAEAWLWRRRASTRTKSISRCSRTRVCIKRHALAQYQLSLLHIFRWSCLPWVWSNVWTKHLIDGYYIRLECGYLKGTEKEMMCNIWHDILNNRMHLHTPVYNK